MLSRQVNRVIKSFFEKRRDHQYQALLKRHGIRDVNKINTFTSKEELRVLYSLASKANFGVQGLEIGSYLGASTCYIVAGLAHRNGYLTCVDTWNNETMPEGVLDTYAEFTKNTRPISQYITTIRKNSIDLSPSDFSNLFDFVFIDGDHSYAAVNNDFCLVEKITSPEAIVLFHDALYFEGVTRTIGEALAAGSWRLGGLVDNLLWIFRRSIQ